MLITSTLNSMNPGQQVICINGDFSELLSLNPNINVPQQDKIYTVRDRFNFLGRSSGITLEEIHNIPVKGSKIEPNFNVSRFALLSEANVLALVEEEEYSLAA